MFSRLDFLLVGGCTRFIYFYSSKIQKVYSIRHGSQFEVSTVDGFLNILLLKFKEKANCTVLHEFLHIYTHSYIAHTSSNQIFQFVLLIKRCCLDALYNLVRSWNVIVHHAMAKRNDIF